MSKEEFDKLRQDVRVLIVTAMSVEADAVNRVLDAQPLAEGIIPRYQQFRFGYFGKYLAAHIVCGQAGLRSAVEVTTALADLRGEATAHSFYVLMPGICCGLKRSISDTTTIACAELRKYLSRSNTNKLPQPIAIQLRASVDTAEERIVLPAYMTPETTSNASTQLIGDVLIASSLWQHNYLATKPDRTEDRGGRFDANSNRLQLVMDHAEEWRQTCPEADYGSHRCQVHRGLMISGDELLNHLNRREELRAEYKDAIGLDMEGHGLGTSVLSYSAREREGQAWFLFAKGICDWGVGKGDGWQERAAAASVSLLRHCLDDPNFFSGLVQPVDKEAISEIWYPENSSPDKSGNLTLEGGPFITNENAPLDGLQACNQQVERSIPIDWTDVGHISRTDLASALYEFRQSDRTLFVLVGHSGSGKSWECAAEAAGRLNNHARMLIRGSDLVQIRSLAELIYAEFADVVRTNTTPEELIRHFIGLISDPAHGPFVLIADDLPLTSDPAYFEDTLENLCRQAQQRGIKLLITARSGVWQRLAEGRRLAPYLFHRIFMPERPLSYSYDLAYLTDDEMRSMLARLIPTSIDVGRVALALRRPAFASLRNPYLLTVYARQHLTKGLGTVPVLVDVDALLDQEAGDRFREVGRRINCEPDEVHFVKEAFVSEMWLARRTGKPSGELIRALDRIIAGTGRQTLHALQSEDILARNEDIKAPVGSVTFANPQFGDRLMAIWLADRIRQGEDVLGEMEPGLDDGVMIALVRQAIEVLNMDAIEWAESVLLRNQNWLSAVAQGVAQRRGDDWRVPAILNAWHNRSDPFAGGVAMLALGEMAGCSAYARMWISALYMDEDETQAFKGQIALGAALSIVPAWVRRQIIVRLWREFLRPPSVTMGHENIDYVKRLRGALHPLQNTSHAESASIARSILGWFQKRYRAPRSPEHMDVRESLRDVISAIRGDIALYGSQDEITTLLEEFDSENVWTRQDAAHALFSVAFGRPGFIKEAIFRRARVETHIMGLVCRLLYFYTDSDPAGVIETVKAGNLIPTKACCIVLWLLARISRFHPQLELPQLPDQFNNFPNPARAFASEMLAFAWLQYANQAAQYVQARKALESLSLLNYGGIEDKYRAFVAHSASCAVFARIGLDIAGMSSAIAEAPIILHDLSAELNYNFLYVHAQVTCGHFVEQMAQHKLFTEWINLLCQTTIENSRYQIHPIETAPSEWQFRVTTLATDWLCACTPFISDPATIVALLLPDWPLLRFCTALVHANRITTEIAELACQLCAGQINVMGNISEDRDRFLYALRDAKLLPLAYAGLLNQQSKWADDHTLRLEADIKQVPEALLESLHNTITKENALPTLWEWPQSAISWRPVLLSHTFRTMFSTAPLSLHDCQRICGQVLTVVTGLRDTGLALVYQRVYLALHDFAAGKHVETSITDFGNDLISRSHRMAMEVVRSFQRSAHPLADDWFLNLICRGEGWVCDRLHSLENGRVNPVFGANVETLYFLPAFRLALTIASLHVKQSDYVSDWMIEQVTVQAFLSTGPCKNITNGWYLHYDQQAKETMLTSALAQVEQKLVSLPNNPRLNAMRGTILLLLDQIDQAEPILKACLTLRWYDSQLLAGVRYNLACCYARKGFSEQCYPELKFALPNMPHMGKKQVAEDPDFADIRGEKWFYDLISTLPDLPYIE
jgi:nucleoside phosphorylase